MIRAIIIDDESNNVENFHLLLRKYCPEVSVVAVAFNAIDGKKHILEHQPDLLFLDI